METMEEVDAKPMEVDEETKPASPTVEVSPTKSERHCLCDSRDYSTFMICCDFCGVWYHGDCVQVTRTVAKRIEKYFCSICISKDGSLEIVYKGLPQKKEKTPRIEDKKEPAEKKEKKVSIGSAPAEKCGNCVGCMWEADCGKCVNCMAQQQPCLKRICVQAGQLQASKKRKMVKPIKKDVDEEYVVGQTKSTPGGKTLQQQHTAGPLGKPGRKSTKHLQDQADSEKKAKKESANNMAKVYNGYYKSRKPKAIVEEEERQCNGPGCIQSARQGSNYCSDDCGMALAEKRLKYILPDRIAAYHSQTPISELQDNEKIGELKESKSALEQELKKLDECWENVNNWISTLSNAIPNSQSESSVVDDGTFLVACAVCTMEFSMKNIGKHMQRCFVRTEKQSTFGTPLELPTNPRNLVCDSFNKIDKTYCKRLKVMCSEHYKDPTEDEIKVCGAPLMWFDGKTVEFKSMFVEPEQLIKDGFQFCMEKRKHCHVHNSWAQNALGLIDNERMNILLQLDENQEKLRQLVHKKSSRGDVLSLLCNSTISHQPPIASAVTELNQTSTNVDYHVVNDIQLIQTANV